MSDDIDWTSLGKKKEEPKRKKVERPQPVAENYIVESRENSRAYEPEYDDLKSIIGDLQKDYLVLEKKLRKDTQLPPIKKIQRRIISRREKLKKVIKEKYPNHDFDRPIPMNQYGIDLDVDKPIFEYEELGRLLNRFHRDSGNLQRLLDFINKYILKGSKKKKE